MQLSTAPIRPRWARVVAGLLLAIVVVGAVILISSMVRAGTDQVHYTISIVTLTLAAVVFLSMQIAVVAKPTPDGLYVRNLVKRYYLKWPQIISVRFSPDRPWAQLDLSYGEPINVMAIQSSDGKFAHHNAERLAAWVRTGEAEEP
ncbi:MAG TPA: PH domain-containing protein [Beutenbergiaceae bacterium]|nr:PH domain-containing protein [Beutenbergiaceae bacterium]